MIVHVASLLIISYILFAFISDGLNPFATIKAPLKRRRWRFGKSAATSSILAGSLAIILLHYFSISERSAIAIYLGLGFAFVTPAAIRYKKSALWQ